MVGQYFIWQFAEAPLWLLTLAWNVQRLLLKFFSVGFMLRTLFAHWHKDAVAYTGGRLSAIALAFAWNQISRGIGCFIRSVVLALWCVSAIAAAVVSIAAFLLFITWPFLVILGFSFSVAMIIS
jgi:hypothetical protein